MKEPLSGIPGWVSAALEASLTPSQHKVWLALLMQTACYGKTHDDLSDSRIEKLSGLRRDHARAAVTALVDAGLVSIVGPGKYGTVYRIPERYVAGGAYAGFQSPAVAQLDHNANAAPDHGMGDAYAELAGRHQQLLDAHQRLIESTQMLVETNQKLVNALPTLGESYPKVGEPSPKVGERSPNLGETLPESWSESPLNLVTNIYIPTHKKTTTYQEYPETWEEPPSGREEGWEGRKVDFCQPEECAAVPAVVATALEYPQALTAEERAEAPRKLDGLSPAAAQEVLDALAWLMANGKVKKSNIGLLCAMAGKARDGTFDRTPALEWRKRRQAEQAKVGDAAMTGLILLGNEIRALQKILKASGVEDKPLAAKIEGMKASYYRDLAVYKAGKDEGACHA